MQSLLWPEAPCLGVVLKVEMTGIVGFQVFSCSCPA
jgi:hypothetical protein